MSKALAWIRKSKGDESDVGLEEQRELVPALANEVADEVDILDLGIHTGFSTMTRDDPAGLLDQNERVQEAVDELKNGVYTHLVALDDRRVCRDEYFSVIQYAAVQGDAEIVYVADVNEDDLTFDLKRRIERDTKEEEIEKSRRAIERRKEHGYDHGRPRFGMTYDSEGHYQVPGEEFETVLEIFQLDSNGKSRREIADAVGKPTSTVQNVLKRREWYVERGEISKEGSAKHHG
ncbi:helix-turn-helix domain-containing protein [Halorubrum ezzemoulense]|uniref:helix-turn-helix domain-containing protein n=1 Tax=Halorubrum ezzemoulense TaxID=337243 RepID=UPI0023302EAA|nr:helix-turn-helix domain-containing protein [Halorubrum ezzemoulense]MDB9254065.1 helix-turn-helix domain-containing protein [Halorubrum ezzemoulense]MDB9257494.1 helix-turn-helix domain-containing protein [Halorubrum ezzemoulense]MDB9278135.1 helix-turn-helix domain-containing protein [Halorubrum ezzemoulense]